MKKIICNACSGLWYIEDSTLDRLRSCPFCSASLRKKRIPETPDTLDVAIYMALCGLGPNPLASPEKLRGYIADIAPSMKRELRILSHSFSNEYFSIVRSAFARELPEAETELHKLALLLMEDIGLSSDTANHIQSSYLSALRLTRGIGLEEILLAEVQNCQSSAASQSARRPESAPKQQKQPRKGAQDPTARQNTARTAASKIPPDFSLGKEFVISGTELVKYTGDSQTLIIPEGITAIAADAFMRNKHITHVRFPDTLRTIGGFAFFGCENLSTVLFNTGLETIQTYAFSCCAALEVAYLPDSVTELGSSCFSSCTSLCTVHLPANLTVIPENTFDDCCNLTSVLIPAKVHSIMQDAFPKHTQLIYR